jgi:hypothetical protein
MGLFDKLKERFAPPAAPAHGVPQGHAAPAAGRPAKDPDEVAVERYRYMLRTAPPETIEQAHAEAFAKLTPEQRRKVLADVSAGLPPEERATSDDPRSLARMATRAEMRQPGTMERALGGGRGMGMGGMIAGTLLASVAGAFIGTAIADAFFDEEMGAGEMGGEEFAGGEEMAADPGFEDPGADLGGGDF